MAKPLKKSLKFLLALLFTLICFTVYSQDTSFIKVLFLYGSRPAAKFKNEERKWFGGKLGGHVGIEADSDRVLNFGFHGKFHWFANKKDKHSRYRLNTETEFWHVFRSGADSVKKAIVIIPVTKTQQLIFDSLQKTYLQQTPYDYALFGMRCGAAAYDNLALLGILKKYSHTKTYIKIFYPKKLRRRLFAKAKKNGWQIIKQQGTPKRKWERG